MSLAHLQADLDAHQATRPVQPCPIAEMTDQQYSEWQALMGPWAAKKATLVGLLEGVTKTQPLDRNPRACTPPADYHYRGPMPRKRKAA